MAGQKYYTQIDMRTPPTDGNHLVRLDDMKKYVAGLTTAQPRRSRRRPPPYLLLTV